MQSLLPNAETVSAQSDTDNFAAQSPLWARTFSQFPVNREILFWKLVSHPAQARRREHRQDPIHECATVLRIGGAKRFTRSAMVRPMQKSSARTPLIREARVIALGAAGTRVSGSTAKFMMRYTIPP